MALCQEATVDEPERFVTKHSGTFNGVEINYEATASGMVLEDEDGNPNAMLFSISYLMEGVERAEDRPVTFLWNGGPGSSSVWLHMGVFGPMRVDVPSDARDDGGPPYRLIPNPGAFLDVSDVVFIDPIGTGFSRLIGEGEGEDYWGVKQDARSIATFIRRWLSENGRWNSPKFLGGESYGTTRSAAVVRELEGGFDDVAINGVILVSTILDFTSVVDSAGNEMPYVTQLPTMAATARYHGKAGTEVPLEQFVEEARSFARGDYIQALLLGNGLVGEQRERVLERLAYFTGLSKQYLVQCDLRVRADRFQKELLRDRGLTVGRLDSRYSGTDMDFAGESPEIDPSFYGIDGAYAATLNTYLRDTLQADMEEEYTIIGGLWGSWDWSLTEDGERSFHFNVAPFLGSALRQNSDLRVFVASGYYDFATPFFGAELSLTRAGVPDERVQFEYYEAGHMMYVNHPSLDKLQADVRAFLQSTLKR